LDAILPFTSEVIPLWKDEEDRIRALAYPPALASSAEALADALAELSVSLLEVHIAKQRNDNARRVDGIQRGVDASRTIEQASRELRLPACAAQRIP
jgi:3-dehydroquinate dehydratase